MDIKNKPVTPWLFLTCLGMVTVLAACGVSEGTTTAMPVAPTAPDTPVPTETPSLRLEDSAVEVQDGKNGWVPIGAETTFDLIGKLENTNPWMVTGNTFAVRDSTRIDKSVKVGDLVEVKGVVLEDATWLASSIELAKEQIYPTLILTGKLNSTDPWVLSGMMLNVTVGTKVAENITPGTIVRAKIFLLEKGAWDVVSLAPLSNFTDVPGCATVTATVASVKGSDVQFAGWPTISLAEEVKIENEAGDPVTLSADRSVLIVVCPTVAGKFMITKIVVLKNSSGGTSSTEAES